MPLKYVGRHLMVKAKFSDAIRTGKKRATIRLGRVDVRSREVLIHAGGKIIAKAIIKNVVYKRVKELTDNDARIDGLNSREELINELGSYYGNIRDNDIVSIIEFEVVEVLDEPEWKYPQGLTPHEIAKLALENLGLSEKEQVILKTLIEMKSIRKTAKKLFGKLSDRWKVRRVLQKCVSKLIEKGVIANEMD